MKTSSLFRIVISGLCAWALGPASFLPTARAAEGPCPKLLVADDEGITDLDFAITTEEHALEEMLHADPATNLAVKHPSLVMDAFQRAKAWALFKTPRYISDPLYTGEPIRLFPVFSEGIKEVGGRRIIGQYSQIETFGSYLYSGSSLDRSSVRMPTFYGPPGTAKTEFMKLLIALSKHLQTNEQTYFNYSYEWVDLLKIPKLTPFVNSYSVDDKGNQTLDGYVFPIPCPLGDSPFVLLPPSLQDKVTALANDKVVSMIEDAPHPWKPLCPHCHFIREAVLEHHAKISGKKQFSPSEIVKILGKHIKIKRRIIGRGGQVPKVNAEGRDVDYHGLFLAPNPFVLNQFGPTHPFAYWINGKIAGAHGGIAFFDEYWRNDPTLRDVFLELLESQVITRGGAPEVQLNFVPIAGSNSESIAHARKTQQANAQIDRSKRVFTPWSTIPQEVGATIVYMKTIERFKQQALALPAEVSGELKPDAATEAPILPGRLDDLFPLPVKDQPLLGPDHRYKVWIGSGKSDIHMGPHSLAFMSLVIAGTRINTDAAAARQFGAFHVIDSAVFRDPIARLKVLMKQIQITPGEAHELKKLSRLLKDGTKGITTRDAADWLTETIQLAQKPGYGGCVTPILLKDTLERMIETEMMECADNETRLKWLQIVDAVAHHFTVPSIEDDVNGAVGYDSGTAEAHYDEIYEELMALQADPNAQIWQNEDTGEVTKIKHARLAEVEEAYKQMNNGRGLARDNYINHHARWGKPKGGGKRHEGVMGAIRRYLAANSKKLVTSDELLRVANTGEGTSEARARFSSVQSTMLHRYGYCPKCMKAALELSNQADLMKPRPMQHPH